MLKNNIFKFYAVAMSLSMMSFGNMAIADPVCGWDEEEGEAPIEDWVKHCPAGIDAEDNSGDITIKMPCGGSETEEQNTQKIFLQSPRRPRNPVAMPMRIERGAGTEREDGTGSVINMEILSMVLKSGSYVGGKFIEDDQFTIRAGRDEGVKASYGKIEQADGATRAESSFEVYFEIDTPYGTLRNYYDGDDPKALAHLVKALDITMVPPMNEPYLPPGTVEIPLYDENGVERACVVASVHKLPVTFIKELTTTSIGNNNVVKLTWATGYEEHMAGFAVYRGDLNDPTTGCTTNVDDYSSITMVSWEDSQGVLDGASYSVTDSTASQCYGLLAVGFDGTFDVQVTSVD